MRRGISGNVSKCPALGVCCQVGEWLPAPHSGPGFVFWPIPQPSLTSPCTHAPAAGIPRAETRATSITHSAKDSALFSLHNVEHSHGEHSAVSYNVKVLLCTAGITFGHTTSNLSAGEGIQNALSAGTLCRTGHRSQAGGHWQIWSCSIKILRTAASLFQ